ncbi:hypothetical protein HG530_001519 [Fusarium avenaceum]|nr:hypothetical protein HG530_001519 [Fusarium avenaceum]
MQHRLRLRSQLLVPSVEDVAHLGQVTNHLGHIIWQVIRNQKYDVCHGVVPEWVVNGMAFRANPQANPWLLDEIEQLRILDILCLENDAHLGGKVLAVAKNLAPVKPTDEEFFGAACQLLKAGL